MGFLTSTLLKSFIGGYTYGKTASKKKVKHQVKVVAGEV